MPLLTHYLRQWDMASASRVDRFAATSCFVRGRIRKFYVRDAEVIYPPVSVDTYAIASPEDYSHWGAQLWTYTRPALVIDDSQTNGLQDRQSKRAGRGVTKR